MRLQSRQCKKLTFQSDRDVSKVRQKQIAGLVVRCWSKEIFGKIAMI